MESRAIWLKSCLYSVGEFGVSQTDEVSQPEVVPQRVDFIRNIKVERNFPLWANSLRPSNCRQAR